MYHHHRLLTVIVVTVCTVALSVPAPAEAQRVQAPQDVTLTLAATGDLMLARTIGAALARDPTDSPFADVTDVLRSADVTVGNLECAMGSGGTPAHKAYTFLAPPAAAASLADAGFDVLSLATNHSMDYGPQTLSQTIQLLEAAGIRHAGAGLDEASAHRPVFMSIKGLRLAFLAYVNVPIEGDGFNTQSWEAKGDQPGVAWAEPGRIAADVAAARRQADLVIVLLHSGYEGVQLPNDIQRANAHAAIDAGAALVIGSHPHVLQGIEYYHGGVIAYSLGNFVFDGLMGTGRTAILRVTLGREGVYAVEWVPVVLRAGRPQLVSR